MLDEFKEDIFLGIDIPDDSSVKKLKALRDRVTFRRDEKERLIREGFIRTVDFTKGKSEVVVMCEILCLLSDSKPQDLVSVIPHMLDYMTKKISYPFTRHDISLVRSYKNIILNYQYDSSLTLFIKLLLFPKETYALKNEIINLLFGILQYKDISRELSDKKIFHVLNNPNLNSVGLISHLLSPENCSWVKIGKILKNIEGTNKIHALSSCIKWYSYVAHDFRPILDVLSKYILVDKTCLFYFAKVIEGNSEAQEYCMTIGLLEKICLRYEDDICSEVVYALACLVENFETNRKLVAESSILSQIFLVFKNKCMMTEYDILFKYILDLFRGMTRSIFFLRCHLLDYPIIELLFSCLESPDQILDGVSLHKSVLLILINLVLEYGNYKKKFIQNKGCARILKFKEIYPIEVLLIFKNYLYDTNWKSKELFVSATDQSFLNYFFKLFEDSQNFTILEILFNLIRNLVCDDSLEIILVSYDNLITQVFKYLKNIDNEKILVQILYTIGNLAANSLSFRDLILVEDTIEDLKRACLSRDLQLAFVWIIINVSWKDEGYRDRVEKLKEFGIREFLLRLNAADTVLLDKINTALENIK